VQDSLSILASGNLTGASLVQTNHLVSCRKNAISCPFSIARRYAGNTHNVDPDIFTADGLSVRLNGIAAAAWKARGLGNYSYSGTPISFAAQNRQSFTDCSFEQVLVANGIEVSFVNCKIVALHIYGAPKLTCVGCDIQYLQMQVHQHGETYDLKDIRLLKTRIDDMAFIGWSASNHCFAKNAPRIVMRRNYTSVIRFRAVPTWETSGFMMNDIVLFAASSNYIMPLGFLSVTERNNILLSYDSPFEKLANDITQTYFFGTFYFHNLHNGNESDDFQGMWNVNPYMVSNTGIYYGLEASDDTRSSRGLSLHKYFSGLQAGTHALTIELTVPETFDFSIGDKPLL
jgi:hypothetical protein